MKHFQTDKERQESQKKIEVFKLLSLYLSIEDMQNAGKADPLWRGIANWVLMLQSIPFNKECSSNPIHKVTAIYALGKDNPIKTVKYSDTPIHQKPEVKIICIEEVGEKIVKRKKFKWTEVMHVHKTVGDRWKETFKTLKKHYRYRANKIDEYYHLLSSDYASTFHAKLLIRKINSVAGWGLFTLKFIPKGSLILVYSGKITCETQENVKVHDVYKFSWENAGLNRLHLFVASGEYDPLDQDHAYISAKSFGNYARFMLHAPLKEKLNQYQFFNSAGQVDETIKENIAHANVRLSCFCYHSCPVLPVEALEDIPENSPLLFDYGDGYWNGLSPSFFKSDGTPDNHQFEKKPIPQNVENATNNEENSNDNCETVLTYNHVV